MLISAKTGKSIFKVQKRYQSYAPLQAFVTGMDLIKFHLTIQFCN